MYKITNNRRGFVISLLIAIIAVLIIGSGVYLYETKKVEAPDIVPNVPEELSTTTKPIACTMDAKMCPDGTYVGRSGPNCEFVCPAIPVPQYNTPIIFSPNGGEVLKIGDIQSISWASLYTNHSSSVNITISANFSGCFNLKQGMACLPVMDPVFKIASSTPNTGTYKWEVGTFLSSEYSNSINEGKYYLKICDSVNKNICDVSDELFEIRNLLRVCPESKTENKMPIAVPPGGLPPDYPPSVYYILDGKRRELTEFDQVWVKSNCNVKEYIVY
ncbi:MAG: hypothetical protein WCW14_02295 [Candidatus Paceibacterota bacterium]|jgi:hypothetical protein